jgi:hypothetical protein
MLDLRERLPCFMLHARLLATSLLHPVVMFIAGFPKRFLDNIAHVHQILQPLV